MQYRVAHAMQLSYLLGHIQGTVVTSTTAHAHAVTQMMALTQMMTPTQMILTQVMALIDLDRRSWL